jgi:hypothetical protein
MWSKGDFGRVNPVEFLGVRQTQDRLFSLQDFVYDIRSKSVPATRPWCRVHRIQVPKEFDRDGLASRVSWRVSTLGTYV